MTQCCMGWGWGGGKEALEERVSAVRDGEEEKTEKGFVGREEEARRDPKKMG